MSSQNRGASPLKAAPIDHNRLTEKNQLLDILSSDNRTFEQCLQQFNNKFNRN